jgi:magnesium and cobalt transporter
MSRTPSGNAGGGDKGAAAKATGRWRSRLTRTLAAGLTSRAQLIEMLGEAQLRGVLDAEAFAMLEGVLAVADLQVRDIMVPRPQMICVRHDDGLDRILPLVIESGHSRFPVLADDRDDVVGVLLAKDLLRLYASGAAPRFSMREYLRPTAFVPESKRLNVLLREFRGNRSHMAMVIDEYGGVAGLVTIEDVIEQIVGDIDDEFDIEEDQDIRRENERQFAVRGATRIEEFNSFFNVRLPHEEFDTIAGLVLKHFGRMPRRGEAISIDELEFRVVRADRRHIDTLRVTLPVPLAPVSAE